ncbi:Gfo/Idh/MocA family protein [Microbacterium amylolyticum]|uniref:Dehydrogenase n=1 Tax=Microbacterium amylolyticum TaxID=936337 RepID=A0ABS4ZIS5_9MICO|nr:putative dehydrogenase [Microbacterium amylolyticum]
MHSEAAVLAGRLIDDGAIGRVVHVTGMGPHRIGIPQSRPEWFFDREKFGGIICDLGSHNFEQMLHFTAARSSSERRDTSNCANTPTLPPRTPPAMYSS